MGTDAYYRIFKTITSDNGSEFSELTQVHDHVFYADPYSPWERGSNEINNRFLRKEITKGEAINNYSSAQIIATNDWMNHYHELCLMDIPQWISIVRPSTKRYHSSINQ